MLCKFVKHLSFKIKHMSGGGGGGREDEVVLLSTIPSLLYHKLKMESKKQFFPEIVDLPLELLGHAPACRAYLIVVKQF